jgi:hypothetical protein
MLRRVARKLARVISIYVSVAITLSGRTHMRRWRKVATEIPPWDERNRLIASLIPDGSSVVDLGSGAMTLRTHLKRACTYQPCDVIPSAPEVLLCDFNASVYPTFSRYFDYVVCSGILEYVADVRGFLSRAAGFGKTLLISYNPRIAGQSRVFRMSNNWVNSFTKDELERLFEEAELKGHLISVSPSHELLYKLTHLTAQTRTHGGRARA